MARRKSPLPEAAFDAIFKAEGSINPQQTLALRPDLTRAQQNRLLAHPHPYVRKALAGNPNLEPEVREALLADSEEFVRQTAQAHFGPGL